MFLKKTEGMEVAKNARDAFLIKNLLSIIILYSLMCVLKFPNEN